MKKLVESKSSKLSPEEISNSQIGFVSRFGKSLLRKVCLYNKYTNKMAYVYIYIYISIPIIYVDNIDQYEYENLQHKIKKYSLKLVISSTFPFQRNDNSFHI